jgi:allantoicase
VQASARAHGAPDEIAKQAEGWPVLLPEVKLSADSVHVFRDELAAMRPVKFVRLNIYPDGGVSRLRVVGKLAR